MDMALLMGILDDVHFDVAGLIGTCKHARGSEICSEV